MAHSNRKKLRDARGGMTRHQSQKAAKKAQYRAKSGFNLDERLRELKKWEEERETRQAQGKTQQTVAPKRRRYSMTKPAQMRRVRVLERTLAWLDTEKHIVKQFGEKSKEHKEFLDSPLTKDKRALVVVLKSRIKIAA